MDKRAGEEADSRELKVDIPENKVTLTNRTGTVKKSKKKADDFAEEPDVDPGVDFMRWSD